MFPIIGEGVGILVGRAARIPRREHLINREGGDSNKRRGGLFTIVADEAISMNSISFSFTLSICEL